MTFNEINLLSTYL